MEVNPEWKKLDGHVAGLAAVAKLEPKIAELRAGQIESGQLAALYLVLRNTHEVSVHQMRGATNNKVYVNADGREAVIDEHGEHVTGFNKGTFNYANGAEAPLRHLAYDMWPWIAMGAERTDPTSRDERVEAYSLDLVNGILYSQQQRAELDQLPVSSWDAYGQVAALALIATAIERGEATEFLGVVTSAEAPSPEVLEALRSKLVAGLVATIPERGPLGPIGSVLGKVKRLLTSG